MSTFRSVYHLISSKEVLEILDYVAVRHHSNQYQVLKCRLGGKRQFITEEEHKINLSLCTMPLVFDSRYLEKDKDGLVRLW